MSEDQEFNIPIVLGKRRPEFLDYARVRPAINQDILAGWRADERRVPLTDIKKNDVKFPVVGQASWSGGRSPGLQDAAQREHPGNHRSRQNPPKPPTPQKKTNRAHRSFSSEMIHPSIPGEDDGAGESRRLKRGRKNGRSSAA